MNSKSENSYTGILKGISFFGSVQVLQTIINIVRGKFIAALLGPSGMGIAALFNSSAMTLQRLSSLGLNLAIVKEIAGNSDSEQEQRHVIAIAGTLVKITAMLGALICILFSGKLSMVTFGNAEMRWQFMLLGVSVGLTIAYSGKLSVLQGLHEVKKISRASLVGAIAGLMGGVPLYYFFGTKGIVPAMIITAGAMYLFYSIVLKKTFPKPQFRLFKSLENVETRNLAKKLVITGMILMSNDLIYSLVQYLINVYVRSTASTDIVGYYQAAGSITAQYSGIIFAVMAMDYFPRLSKAASDNGRMNQVVNRQICVTGLIAAPASALLILTSPLAIRVLLSPDFLPVTELMRWMGLGIMVRAMMVPLGYITFAKGNRQLFFWMEGVGCNILTLFLSCVFFHFFGINGLGYAMVTDNMLCLILYYAVNRHLYSFSFVRDSGRILVYAFIITGATFSASFLSVSVYSYILMSIFTVCGVIISVILMKKLLKNDRTESVTES